MFRLSLTKCHCVTLGSLSTVPRRRDRPGTAGTNARTFDVTGPSTMPGMVVTSQPGSALSCERDNGAAVRSNAGDVSRHQRRSARQARSQGVGVADGRKGAAAAGGNAVQRASAPLPDRLRSATLMLRLEARKPHSRRVRSHVADALPNADRAFIRDLIPCLDSARLDLRNGVEGRRSFSTTEPFVHQKAQQLARTERPPLRARAAGRLVFGGQSGLKHAPVLVRPDQLIAPMTAGALHDRPRGPVEAG